MADIRTLKEMLTHIWVILDKKQRLKMIGMMVVILVGAIFELLGVSAILPFIQALLSPEQLMEKPYIRFFVNAFGITDTHVVFTMVGIGIVLIYIIKNIYLSISSYFQVSYSNNTRRQLSVEMLRSYMNRPYSFFVENGSGVVLRGVTSDIDGVYRAIQCIFKLGVEGFVVISIAVYLLYVDLILAIGVLAIGVLCFGAIILGVKKRLSKLSKIYRKSSADLNKFVVQISSGIKDIMVFNKREYFLNDYDNAYKELATAALKSEFGNTLPERIIEGSCISAIIIMVIVRLNMGIDPNEFVPDMAVFAMGAFRILPSISRLTGNVYSLIYVRPMIEGIYENISEARKQLDENDKSSLRDLKDQDISFNTALEIKSLDWRYPQSKEYVLKGLDMTIRKGETIGIIGESGSGKSTLADILLGLYKPQSGGVYMDGVNVSSILDAWSHVISYVPQNVFLIDDTIRANVVFGNDHTSDDEVWEVLRKASLSDFVSGLPDGLDTVVGERGVKFSGGQRQRIAIARALSLNPQILVLDEATSALDSETEEIVMEAIDALSGSVTLIIIAHRLTTLKGCNKIYEIVNGKAVERDASEVGIR